MELPVFYGTLKRAPIFPRPDETHQCIVLNDNCPDKFWLKPLDETTKKHEVEMNKVLKDLYYPLLNKNSPIHRDMILSSSLIDMFKQELEEVDENSDDYKGIVLNYLSVLGDYAVAFIKEKNSFHRVEILHETMEKDMITTHLIDGGCFERVSVKYLWPMSKRLTTFPHLALVGYLAGVTPQGRGEEQHPVSDWPGELLTKFHRLLRKNDVWNVTFLKKSKNMPLTWNALSLSANQLNLNEALLKYTRDNWKRLEGCYHGEVEIFIQAFKELDSLVSDEEYYLSGIFINSIQEIYLTLKIDSEKYGASVRHLEKRINDPLQVKLKKLRIPPTIGEIVLVEHDGVFKRGKCMDGDFDLDTYNIVLLDQPGITESNLKALRVVEADMLHIPFLSRRCMLVNIEAAGMDYEELLLEALKTLAVVEALGMKAKIVADHDILWIELISRDSGDFGTMLIEMGLANKKECLIPAVGQKYIPG